MIKQFDRFDDFAAHLEKIVTELRKDPDNTLVTVEIYNSRTKRARFYYSGVPRLEASK